MAEFICRLGTPAGEVVTRTIDAVGVAEARVRLESEGFRVFSVTPPKARGIAALTRGGKGGTSPRIKAGDFLLFNQQLSALLRAGIPILQSVSMLRRRAASSRLRMMLGDVEEKIRGGMALSAAFAAQGPVGRNLPTITLVVVGISNWMAANIWWFAPLIIIGAVAFWFWSRTPQGRITIDRAVLKIPIAGQLVIQLSVAQVTRSLSTLLAGGITIVESWEIAAEAITNKELRARSSGILPMIREGQSFTESLEAANWIPELGLDMIGVGERSGSLREMLDEVATFYDAESEVRLEQLTTVLEPAILLVMGGVVITILLAIYLPIIQSISNVSGAHAGR
ncbi:MAG: type II secretion system F family protein [Acidobacteria bacterium]|nr:type II secretion system F family protein [Acidobacteriota bacterium]